MMNKVWVSIGSNLSLPKIQVITAIKELQKIRQTRLLKQSSLYETEPVGGVEQDNFINSVVLLETKFEPLALLRELQSIELSHDRVRLVRWGARTLDLDILLYGDSVIDTVELKIPHAEMHHRGFVLVPLAEISPELMIAQSKVTDLALRYADGITKLD